MASADRASRRKPPLDHGKFPQLVAKKSTIRPSNKKITKYKSKDSHQAVAKVTAGAEESQKDDKGIMMWEDRFMYAF